MTSLRIGSRGSQLALWQANHVAERLRARGHAAEIQIIKTTGDKILDVALAKVGTKGMFTKEIEEALAAGEIDLAVHSLKDLPTELGPRFSLAAISEREDPRDVFLSNSYRSVTELPRGARVGTSSLRRQAQLKALRSDLEVAPLRGNVETRLRKLAEGQFDAIVLAAAGLNRLRPESSLLQQAMEPEQMCPAAGQGALGIEVRAGDAATLDAVKFLDHAETRAAVSSERALLAELGGGCQVPIGAYARWHNGQLILLGVVAQPDGAALLRDQQSGSDAQALGRAVAQKLLAHGADRILRDVYGAQAAVPQQP